MIKKGLSLEEAFKALNGKGKVNESEKEKHRFNEIKQKLSESAEETEINETEEEKRINELKNLTFKDLDRDEIYFFEYGYGDDLRIKVRGNKARFSSPGAWDSFTNVVDPNEHVIDYLAKTDNFKADDPETWPFVIEDVEYPSKINENKKQLKEELTELEALSRFKKGEVLFINNNDGYTAIVPRNKLDDEEAYISIDYDLGQKLIDRYDLKLLDRESPNYNQEIYVYDEDEDVKIIPAKPVSEDLTSDVKIPAPYNKYYQVAEIDGGYNIGDQIEGYGMRILAYLDAKPKYEDLLEEPYAVLTDDKDYPVCVIVGGRVYKVSIEDLPQE